MLWWTLRGLRAHSLEANRRALSKLGKSRSPRAFEELARSFDTHPHVLEASLAAMASRPEAQRALAVVLPLLLREESAWRHERVVEGLSAIDPAWKSAGETARLVPNVLQALDGERPTAALRTVRVIHCPGAYERLLRLLGHPHVSVRRLAAEALVEYPDPRSVAVLEKAILVEDYDVAQHFTDRDYDSLSHAGVAALARIEDSTACAALSRIIARHKDSSVRREALENLCRLDPGEAFDALAGVLRRWEARGLYLELRRAASVSSDDPEAPVLDAARDRLERLVEQVLSGEPLLAVRRLIEKALTDDPWGAAESDVLRGYLTTEAHEVVHATRLLVGTGDPRGVESLSEVLESPSLWLTGEVLVGVWNELVEALYAMAPERAVSFLLSLLPRERPRFRKGQQAEAAEMILRDALQRQPEVLTEDDLKRIAELEDYTAYQDLGPGGRAPDTGFPGYERDPLAGIGGANPVVRHISFTCVRSLAEEALRGQSEV